MIATRYYVVLILVKWKELHIEFENSGAIGYLPVYETVEALRKDYPVAPFITVKRDQRKISPQSK
jgi:hypothetical protein